MSKKTIFIILIAIAIVAFFYFKNKVKFSVSKGEKTPGQDANIEYPEARDIVGFDEGDKLTFKGNQFIVANGAWELV